MNAYFAFVILAAVLDVLGNLMLKKSDGFKKKAYGLACIILVLGAFVSLSFAIKEIPLSVAYSVWGAIGIIGTILGGYVFFGERLNVIGYIGVVFVLGSVVLLTLF
ncbi:multidrug/spermidine efflux SMR transporter subunit MdtI [Helicobacter sp. 11S02596-1]|uniref:multidrug/spermidine efflux SMR transporter subunit MdtI n=1 Tax=Helicobacter sp. 11S02596-1 TaxID=1476194 RepID=UPI000BA68A51|nr:multidrug/spermidine efflux SMR transporter subunit MdtI [Helicobacter sp. 11S02596-1]PAF45229.1 QacE family quaternary ammonium compound efflux SMR transporter [Helicobacter sp. 11S02596-1]